MNEKAEAYDEMAASWMDEEHHALLTWCIYQPKPQPIIYRGTIYDLYTFDFTTLEVRPASAPDSIIFLCEHGMPRVVTASFARPTDLNVWATIASAGGNK